MKEVTQEWIDKLILLSEELEAQVNAEVSDPPKTMQKFRYLMGYIQSIKK